MKNLNMKSFQWASLARMVLLGLAAVCVTEISASAHGEVEGTFTMPFEATWGKTLLPAGDYTISIETLNSVQSVSSIQSRRQPVLVTVRPKMGTGAVTMMIAFAVSKDAHTPEPDGLAFESGEKGTVVRSLCLDKMGLVIDFNVPKTKSGALVSAPHQLTTASKASD